MSPTNHILLTIDVEDWFQVENFKQCIPFSSWSSYKLRAEKNTHRLLDLLDSYNEQPTTDNRRGEKPHATFFVLAWLAKRLPHLIREIHARGHEIASHGYLHKLCNEQSTEELRQDLSDSRKLLEDIIGFPAIGYRAPSFSINEDILKIIEECGYHYDSSFNSFGMHGRYGQLDLSRNKNNGISVEISNKFYELPVSNFKIGNRTFPLGGGGYFRMLPFPFFKLGVKNILKKEKAYLFYMHPWEIDPDQPKVSEASPFFKFRHYHNLSNTYSKLSKLIKGFSHSRFITCSQYLDEVKKYAP